MGVVQYFPYPHQGRRKVFKSTGANTAILNMNSTMYTMDASFLLEMPFRLTILCKKRPQTFATDSG